MVGWVESSEPTWRENHGLHGIHGFNSSPSVKSVLSVVNVHGGFRRLHPPHDFLPLIVIELVEDAADGGEGIVGFRFIRSADVRVLPVGNGAGKFPVALIAPGFEPLPSDAAGGQLGLSPFISQVAVGEPGCVSARSGTRLHPTDGCKSGRGLLKLPSRR